MPVILGVGSLLLGGASLVMQASGTKKAAETAKTQSTIDAAQYARQAELASQNADTTLKYGRDNAGLIMAVSDINTALTTNIANMNVGLIQATTDFNVSSIRATTDFNVSSAEGAARLLEARGEAEAAGHRANADLLEVQAQDALGAGGQAEQASRTAYAQLKGQQRARLAANGVTLDEGSALRIQSDTDYASDVDADTIKTNALKAAFGYRISAVNEVTAAKFASLDGSAAALGKRTEAVAARINGSIAIAQQQLDGTSKALNTKMTASYQILQDQMTAKVDALNTVKQSEADAWAMRAQAEGYTGQAAQARLSASSINPKALAATSLVNGASSLAFNAYGMARAGVFG